MGESDLIRPVRDGLPIRPSGHWAKAKLDILEFYIALSTVAMKDKPWRKRFYVDLQAGPGKNFIKDTDEIRLGSPLLALTRGAGYTDYRFVERKPSLAHVLWQRCQVSGRISKGNVIIADCNLAVHRIVDEINEIDSKFVPGQWSCLTFAFFDPEGLELAWDTVAKLATLRRVDLMINFSTGGVRRAATQALGMPPGTTKMDRFFGTEEWRRNPLEPDSSVPIRRWLDLYKERLEEIGFTWGTEHSVPIKISHGVELYRLLFASKSETGIDFWEKARKRGPEQLSLF
jgi:three-Cys-motif partner protein